MSKTIAVSKSVFIKIPTNFLYSGAEHPSTSRSHWCQQCGRCILVKSETMGGLQTSHPYELFDTDFKAGFKWEECFVSNRAKYTKAIHSQYLYQIKLNKKGKDVTHPYQRHDIYMRHCKLI